METKLFIPAQKSCVTSEMSVLNEADIQFYVTTLKASDVTLIGSKSWFDEHQKLERLRQQCIVEATNNDIEPYVNHHIVTNQKMPVLVHEAICIQLWRKKVWKKILKVRDRKLVNGFVAYMILYHECTAVNLLQILVHHKECVESLNDEILDLIDYCAAEIVGLAGTGLGVRLNEGTGLEEDEMDKLVRQQHEMRLNTGLASIAIVASLAESLDELNVSAIVRLYSTHDFPVLLASLMESQPWKRRSETNNAILVYNEGEWSLWDSEELCKCEAQCWIALRALLLHGAARQYYELDGFRRETLLKLQKHLHETTIDQMAPLAQLRQLLSHLSVGSEPPCPKKTPLILETVAPIRDTLEKKIPQWRQLTASHVTLMFDSGPREHVMAIAKSVAETYNADWMVSFDTRTQTKEPKETCQQCGKIAGKKCGQCHKAWYCARRCQVQHWPTHKQQCHGGVRSE